MINNNLKSKLIAKFEQKSMSKNKKVSYTKKKYGNRYVNNILSCIPTLK